MLNDAVNATAARGMSGEELFAEITDVERARKDILRHYSGSVVGSGVGSRLYEILACTLDDLSDYIGALQNEQDSR